MTLIDYDQAVQLLRDVAEEHPDFVYKEWFASCEYLADEGHLLMEREDEEPPCWNCLVGRVLVKAGADEEGLTAVQGSVYTITGRGDDDDDDILGELLGVHLTDDAASLLYAAQNWQDQTKRPWREVVPLAIAGLAWDSAPYGEIEDALQ